jgi:hypothetical protein
VGKVGDILRQLGWQDKLDKRSGSKSGTANCWAHGTLTDSADNEPKTHLDDFAYNKTFSNNQER